MGWIFVWSGLDFDSWMSFFMYFLSLWFDFVCFFFTYATYKGRVMSCAIAQLWHRHLSDTYINIYMYMRQTSQDIQQQTCLKRINVYPFPYLWLQTNQTNKKGTCSVAFSRWSNTKKVKYRILLENVLLVLYFSISI